MSDVKPNNERILQRLSEVLDVLQRISEDLQDISTSLKAASPSATVTTAPSAVAPPTPLAPTTLTSKPVGKGTDDIRMMFTKDLEAMLIFEDKGDFIKVTPRQYLGSDNFAKIASTIREAGGEYISAGRGSHFRIQK